VASPTVQSNSRDFRRLLSEDLTKLRTRGFDEPRVSDLETLLKVAQALTTNGTEVERVEAALEAAIAGWGADTTNYHVARLWFGLDQTTRKLDVHNRHKAAYERYQDDNGKTIFKTFMSHTWGEGFRDTLAKRLADRYTEHLTTPRSQATEIVNETALTRHLEPTRDDDPDAAIESAARPEHTHLKASFRRTPRRALFVALLSLCIVAVGIWQLVSNQSPSHSRTTSTTGRYTNYSLMTPANMPEITRGAGTETMYAHGYYGKRTFIARGGVVLFQRNQDAFEIILYPEPVSCALWYRGTPAGIELDIDVYANAKTLRNVPISHPLNEYYVNWVTSRGNNSKLDTAAASHSFDGLGEPGLVILTAIDTTPGGFWRGRIVTRESKTADGVRQAFNGTFAAQWCNISPGPLP
jgi:hypothetical protein